jgi:hypothetical protein
MTNLDIDYVLKRGVAEIIVEEEMRALRQKTALEGGL